GDTAEPYLAVLITYDTARGLERHVENRGSKFKVQSSKFGGRGSGPARASAGRVRVGLVGAGDYARRMLLPHFKSGGVEFVSIATASGVSARDVGARYGFERFVSGAEEVLFDESVNLVVVATRHDTHASLARRAL